MAIQPLDHFVSDNSIEEFAENYISRGGRLMIRSKATTALLISCLSTLFAVRILEYDRSFESIAESISSACYDESDDNLGELFQVLKHIDTGSIQGLIAYLTQYLIHN